MSQDVRGHWYERGELQHGAFWDRRARDARSDARAALESFTAALLALHTTHWGERDRCFELMRAMLDDAEWWAAHALGEDPS